MEKRPVFFSDIMDGAGRALKKAFNVVANSGDLLTGDARLKKRGLEPHGLGMSIGPAIVGFPAMGLIGAVGTIFADTVMGGTTGKHVITESQFFEIIKFCAISGSVAPFVINHASAAYKASDFDRKQFLLNHEKMKALPQPEAPKTPLI